MAERRGLTRRAAQLLLGPSRPPAAQRYGAALLLVAVAALAGGLLRDGLAPFRVLAFLSAVTLATLRGGTAPGLLAVALSAAAAQGLSAWAPPQSGETQAHQLLFFAGFAALNVWVAATLRASYRHSHLRRRRAEAAADEQRIAARLGMKALADGDVDALLAETLEAVQEALRCDSVTLLELTPDGEAFRLRRSVGLGSELHEARFTRQEVPLAFATLARREPLLADDLSREPELGGELLKHGIVSTVAAPILAQGPGGQPFGVLAAHSRSRRRFKASGANLLQTAANVVGTAILRLATEDRMRDHLASLRGITASLAEGVCAVDRSGTLTFVNPAARALSGWSEDELLGRSLNATLGPRSPDGPRGRDRCPVLGVIRTGEPVRSQEEGISRSDGTVVPVSYTASALWQDGRVVGAVLAFQDFTEHVRAERAERFLAEAGRQLALSIDWEVTLKRVARLALPVLGNWSLVVVLGPDGKPRSVAAETDDPSREGAVADLLAHYPVDLEAPHGVGRILRTGEAELLRESDVESFVGEGADAALRRKLLRRLGLMSYLGAPLEIGGRVVGAIAFGLWEGRRHYGADDLALATELARRCAVALANARLYQAAQDATRVREEVMAVVSHDLKTPLAALLLGAQNVGRLAPAGSAGDELRRSGAAVRRTAERMGRLIHDLVDFGSLEAGRLSMNLAPADGAAVAREALEAMAGLATERGVALALDAPSRVPVVCDPHRLTQALHNLLANALHVTSEGGEVTLRVVAAEGSSTLTVADSGPGIPEDELPHIFERWYRGSRAAYAGSGLGLAIVRGIVEAHGGRVWVESAPGRGSAFHVALPSAPASVET